jgi:hypothetical protein
MMISPLAWAGYASRSVIHGAASTFGMIFTPDLQSDSKSA